jgi:hypothetical protein
LRESRGVGFLGARLQRSKFKKRSRSLKTERNEAQ